MAFKFYQLLSYLDLNPGFNLTAYDMTLLRSFPDGCISEISPYPILNNNLIVSSLQSASVGGYPLYFDLQIMMSKVGDTTYTEQAQEDVRTALKGLYQLCKSYYPNVPIGYYKYPLINAYTVPIATRDNIGSAIAENDNRSWVTSNQRWNTQQTAAGKFVPDPFNNYYDLLFPALYFESGHFPDAVNPSSLVDYVYQANAHLDMAVSVHTNGKIPIIPFVSPYYYDKNNIWASHQYDQQDMIATINMLKDRDTIGCVMLGGFGVSFKWIGWKYRPGWDGLVQKTPPTLTQWKQLKDAAFFFEVSGIAYQAIDIDLSLVTDMSGVAKTIASAMNVAIASLISTYPYNPGVVAIDWDATNLQFLITIQSLGNFPPDNGDVATRVLIGEKPATSGTDIGVYNWIGKNFGDGSFGGSAGSLSRASSNRAQSLTILDDKPFADGWAIGNDWWDVLTSATDNEASVPTSIVTHRNTLGVLLSWT